MPTLILPRLGARVRISSLAPSRSKTYADCFHEIYIKADVEICTNRDPKGLYKKAIKGEIGDFTGISAPYEEPENADLTVDTMANDIEGCVIKITCYIEENIKHCISKKTL